MRVQQSPGQLWVLPGETAKLSCRTPDHSSHVNWYKEKPDGGLYWVCRSPNYTSLVGKYWGTREPPGHFSLTISPAQREDSGVYYCSSANLYPSFGNGTTLIVTSECPAARPTAGDVPGEVCATPSTRFPSLDATEPQLSILVPLNTEEPGQPTSSLPLLCHLHDLPAGWDAVQWQPGGEVTPVTAAAVDEHGVLSAWSIAWVSAERWDGAVECTALESGTARTLSVAISKGSGEGN